MQVDRLETIVQAHTIAGLPEPASYEGRGPGSAARA